MTAEMLSIVMPAHNEQRYLAPAVKTVVTAMRESTTPFEVIVVENGSTDATGQEAGDLVTVYPEVRCLHLSTADYGLALREGFLQSSGDIVVNFDTDLVDVDFLQRSVHVMSDPGISVVVGSKRAGGSEDRRPLSRRAVTAVFSLTLRYGFGLKVTDTHGLKAMRRPTLLPLVERCRFGQDIFDTEMILRAEREGLTVVEIPVSVDEIRPPRSSITRRIPRTLVGLARLRLALARER